MLIQCSHGRTFALANLSAYTLIPQRSICLTSFRYLQYHLLPEKGELLWPSGLKTFKFSILYMIPCSNQMTFWGLSFFMNSVQFNCSVVSLFVTPWTVASLSINKFQSLLKLMSIQWVMLSNHLILCHPLFLPPSIFLSIRVFSNELVLRIRWPKYWSFSFSISPSNERSDWFPLGWTGWISSSPRDSQESSPTPQSKSINSLALSILYSPTLTSIHDHRKNHSLD